MNDAQMTDIINRLSGMTGLHTGIMHNALSEDFIGLAQMQDRRRNSNMLLFLQRAHKANSMLHWMFAVLVFIEGMDYGYQDVLQMVNHIQTYKNNQPALIKSYMQDARGARIEMESSDRPRLGFMAGHCMMPMLRPMLFPKWLHGRLK